MKFEVQLDCRGQLCPVPILMTEEKIAEMKPGQVLQVAFTDPGAQPDLVAWCRATGHELLEFKTNPASPPPAGRAGAGRGTERFATIRKK